MVKISIPYNKESTSGLQNNMDYDGFFYRITLVLRIKITKEDKENTIKVFFLKSKIIRFKNNVCLINKTLELYLYTFMCKN